MMKPFRFQKFTIQQSPLVFRVGTDGVLLGALCEVSAANRILEVGTGTGLIALMCAQRRETAYVSALDIDEAAAALASLNFSASPFSSRMEVWCGDFRAYYPQDRFDLVVCNPPYFEANPSVKDRIARQRVMLDFEDLVRGAVRVLSAEGLLSVIIPSSMAEGFVSAALREGFFLIRKVNIYGNDSSEIRRVVLEFSFVSKACEELDLIIEKGPRVYSDQYLELTRDFHVFGK
ncbi:tRNA1(Val) (adenine(37)-N6)-methyltransferase [Bergeyella sp. RCAD1439]|uniref:tRNA1(Val) (adenine(37)-N6)-methyltransferase n=1 Tax=Bergeyella anatis TaxID=3113737 RepID=UPI002E17BB15|nr:methyltransferase [Bergeyella sp. RCAD1439]